MSKELATATVVAAMIHGSVKNGQFFDTPGTIREIYKVFDSLSSRNLEVHPDFLVCLIDNRRVKNLRKYVKNKGYTWEQYLEKFDLPADYPTVAPAYSARRSAIAKENKLGVKNV